MTKESGWLFAATAALIGGVALFAKLASGVETGDSVWFDKAVYAWFRTGDPTDPIGPDWVEELMRDVTALGSMFFVALVAVVTFGYLMLMARRRLAALLLFAVLGGVALSQGLKTAFARPRPTEYGQAMETFTPSFPSGHATLSSVTFLAMAALLVLVAPSRAARLYILACALLLVVLVGTSRIYLGVHWPTDVLAGWVVGTSWALVCWALANFQRRRHGDA